MTNQEDKQLRIKFLNLWIQNMDNPAECSCDECFSDGTEEDGDAWQCTCPPVEFETFDSAIFHLRRGAGRALSGLQFTAYANDLARKYLCDYEIEYHSYRPGTGPDKGESWVISWQKKPAPADAAALPALQFPLDWSSIKPPRGATYLLWRLLPDGVRETAVGDLEEQFHQDCERIGAVLARLTYCEQVVVSLLDCCCPAIWSGLKRVGADLKRFVLALVTAALSSVLAEHIATFIKSLRE